MLESKKTGFLRKYYKSIIFLIIILAIFAYDTSKINWKSTYREEWNVCIDYIKQGTLYGGQPHCATGPVLFYTGFIFKFLFGDFFQIALKIFVFILGGLLVYLMRKVIKKETGENDLLFILFLFAVWLYSSISGDNLEKVLTMFFAFFGFYLMYYSEIRLNWLYAGLLFSLAIFSSTQTIAVVAVILACYLFKSGALSIRMNKNEKSVSFKPKGILTLMKIAGIMLAVFLTLKLIYPNILDYILLAHSIEPLYSFPVALKHMLPFGYVDTVLFIVYVIAIVSMYVSIKKKNAIPVIGFLGLFIIFFTVHKGSGGFQTGRYALPMVPFVILTLSMLKNDIKKGFYNEVFFYIALMLLVLFPAFYGTAISELIYQKTGLTLRDFQKEVGYSINFIPEQEGMILTDTPDLLTNYDYKFDPSKVVVAANTIAVYTIDEWSGPRLQKLGITDLVKWKPAQSKDQSTINSEEERISKIQKEIETGKYSLIIYGPRGPTTVVAHAIGRMNSSIRSQYCNIILPSLEHLPLTGVHIVTAFMKNVSHCQSTVERMVKYYYNAFEHICSKSVFAANNVVKYTLSLYGVDIGKNCDKGGNFINDFNHHPLFPQHIIFILISVILILIASIPRIKRGNWSENKNAKKMHYLVIIMLAIILVYVLIKSTKDLGYFLNFIP